MGSRVGFSMSEKPESDEFEDEDGEDVPGDEESLDVDRLMQDLDKRKRGASRGAEPSRQVHEAARDHVHHLPFHLQLACHAHQA